MTHPFYRLTAPSTWANAVEVWSWSTLRSVERCARQWQLEHSTWPGFATLPRRPVPAAIEGELVHEAVDALFRSMARHGMPGERDPAFVDAVRATRVMERLQAGIERHNALLAQHPRVGSHRLPFTSAQLYNRVTQLFRQQYKPGGTHPYDARKVSTADGFAGPALGALLRARGALSEVAVALPSLALKGRIDLVTHDAEGVTLVDFKTGAPKPEHRDQLWLYGVLWWRATGVAPSALVVQYPEERTADAATPAQIAHHEREIMVRVEAAVSALRETPTRAAIGAHCARCSVRTFCDEWWRNLPAPSLSAADSVRNVDVEGTVASVDSRFALTLATGARKKLPVVYDGDGATLHGPFGEGERLRIVGGMVPKEGGEVRLTRLTEVFHRGGASEP